MPVKTTLPVAPHIYYVCDKCGAETKPYPKSEHFDRLPMGWSTVQLSGTDPLDDPMSMTFCSNCTTKFKFPKPPDTLGATLPSQVEVRRDATGKMVVVPVYK